MFVLYYHNVLDRDLDPLDECRVDLPRFRAQMEFLARRFEPVTLAEGLSRLEAGDPAPRAVAVTFDDGYAGVGRLAAPAMAACGVPGTVFCITGEGLLHYEESGLAFRVTSLPSADLSAFGLGEVPLETKRQRAEARESAKSRLNGCSSEAERVALHEALLEALGVTRSALASSWRSADPWLERMSAPELRSLRDAGWTVGAHTRTHRRLSQVDGDLAPEVTGCRQDLAAVLGEPPAFLAYPYGRPVDFDEAVMAECARAGFRAAFTTVREEALPGFAPFAVPRLRFPHFARLLEGREAREARAVK